MFEHIGLGFGPVASCCGSQARGVELAVPSLGRKLGGFERKLRSLGPGALEFPACGLWFGARGRRFDPKAYGFKPKKYCAPKTYNIALGVRRCWSKALLSDWLGPHAFSPQGADMLAQVTDYSTQVEVLNESWSDTLDLQVRRLGLAALRFGRRI